MDFRKVIFGVVIFLIVYFAFFNKENMENITLEPNPTPQAVQDLMSTVQPVQNQQEQATLEQQVPVPVEQAPVPVEQQAPAPAPAPETINQAPLPKELQQSSPQPAQMTQEDYHKLIMQQKEQIRQQKEQQKVEMAKKLFEHFFTNRDYIDYLNFLIKNNNMSSKIAEESTYNQIKNLYDTNLLSVRNIMMYLSECTE